MAVKSKNEVIAYLSKNKGRLRKEFGVNRLGLFGSFAKDLQSETSDIDLIVEIDKARKNLHSYMQLRRHLEKELGRKVDIGFENTIKSSIKSKILKELIYV
ncbi:MAG: nucleotidyltransferase family protein [Desulfobacterium sp.]|nr:nucleotidyltransferase family protein [Desulfobacteraceae bacterium]MBA3038053.1 nucleotidyltransferase family protein [Desulfobacterium sp.]MBU4036337.1 nucleotidyltransferase family protein [Pseudomonadota bacterium]